MFSSSPISPLDRLRWLSGLLLALAGTSVSAGLSLSATLEQYLAVQTQGLPGKVTYTIGALDHYARQTPCSAYEAFLPAGSRLWGRTNVGVRCLSPTVWTVYVPVQVRIAGTYLLTARRLTAGEIVAAGDLVTQEGDLGSLPAGVLNDHSQAIGKTIKNSIAAGQPLRGDVLASPWVIQQGQSVKLVTTGAGFTASNEGKALNNAVEGQVAQVRTASGQVISGVARGPGVVEVSY